MKFDEIAAIAYEKCMTDLASREKESNNSVVYDTAESNTEDFDEMLDDYEAYIDQYIEFYKKSLAGDMSALSEYPALLEKANNLQQSMEKAQNADQLTIKQIKRMSDIQLKMLEGLQ